MYDDGLELVEGMDYAGLQLRESVDDAGLKVEVVEL